MPHLTRLANKQPVHSGRCDWQGLLRMQHAQSACTHALAGVSDGPAMSNIHCSFTHALRRRAGEHLQAADEASPTTADVV